MSFLRSMLEKEALAIFHTAGIGSPKVARRASKVEYSFLLSTTRILPYSYPTRFEATRGSQNVLKG